MKIFYFNDRTTPRDVFFNTLNSQHIIVFQPQEGRTVVFPAPEGAVLWVKEWDSYTLISYIESEPVNGKTSTIPGS